MGRKTFPGPSGHVPVEFPTLIVWRIEDSMIAGHKRAFDGAVFPAGAAAFAVKLFFKIGHIFSGSVSSLGADKMDRAIPDANASGRTGRSGAAGASCVAS